MICGCVLAVIVYKYIGKVPYQPRSQFLSTQSTEGGDQGD